jgi:hypothetical protein
VVAAWIRDAQTKRQAAQAKLDGIIVPTVPTAAEVQQMLEHLGDLRPHLAGADLALKAKRNRELGVSASWDPATDHALVEVAPCPTGERVGGATRTITPRVQAAGEFAIAA